MNSSRRTLLKILGLTGATLPLIGCERLISSVTQQMGQSIPSQFEHRGRTADRSRVSFVVARCLRSVAGRFGPRADDGSGKMDRRTTRAGQD